MKRLPVNAQAQLKKARESALLAVEVYNKPSTEFKSGGYIVLMIIAWTALFHAVFWKRGKKPFARDPRDNRRFARIDGECKCWELGECLHQYYGSNTGNGIRKNLEFFIPLRNQIEHRFMPELDPEIYGECQAMLFNFDEIVQKEFGAEHCIRECLSFALQLFPSTKTLASSLTANPANKSVAGFITRYRALLTAEAVSDGKFAFRAFLVQVANHQGPNTLPIQFFRSQDLTEEQQKELQGLTTVLIKNKTVAVRNPGLLKPGDVVRMVQIGLGNPTKPSGKKQIPWFTLNRHVDCFKRHKVRPKSGDAHPEVTRAEFCVYDSLHKDYGYTQAWVDFLIREHLPLVPVPTPSAVQQELVAVMT